MRILKISKKLFATTILATLILLPEAGQAAQRIGRNAQAQAQVHAAHVANLNAFIAALSNPLNALADGSALDTVLRAASGDGASAATGVIVTAHGVGGGIPLRDEKIQAMQRIEGGPAHDDQYKIRLRQAFGLPSDAASLLGGSPESAAIRRFHEIANEELIIVPQLAVELAGLGGVGATALQQVNAIKVRLDAGTHGALNLHGVVAGANIGAAGAASATLNAALQRLGM